MQRIKYAHPAMKFPAKLWAQNRRNAAITYFANVWGFFRGIVLRGVERKAIIKIVAGKYRREVFEFFSAILEFILHGENVKIKLRQLFSVRGFYIAQTLSCKKS